jgi:hypothetical protein
MGEPVLIALPTEAKAVFGSETNGNVATTRLNYLATFGAAVALALVANVSDAAPLSHGAAAIIDAGATLSLVEQAHGTHRSCRRGWIQRWRITRWHRHVGRSHAPIRC